MEILYNGVLHGISMSMALWMVAIPIRVCIYVMNAKGV